MATCELCNCPLTILRNGKNSMEYRRQCARCDPENEHPKRMLIKTGKRKKPAKTDSLH